MYFVKIISFNVLAYLFILPIIAQNNGLNQEQAFLTESYLIQKKDFHLTIKPLSFGDLSDYDTVSSINFKRIGTYRLLNNNLVEIKNNTFDFKINPVAEFMTAFHSHDNSIAINIKAGLSLSVSLNKKWLFSTDIVFGKNDKTYTELIDYGGLKIVPHYGKAYSVNDNAYLFTSLTGDFGFMASKNIEFHIGRGKHFFGNGKRSLLFSDNSNAYPYFKTITDIWKIKYVWMIAQFNDVQVFRYEKNPELYDKAAFIHYLSLNITHRINFNFFEAVISSPYDREGRRSGYEAAYFNPVIFYRPVEFYSGTSDNSLMGMGLNVKIFKSMIFYSQFILDDLAISRISDGTGWWGNKYGFQVGIKYYELFKVNGLFFRMETNLIRPYTFSHGEAYVSNGIANLNYGNYVQPMAHPSGADFLEGIIELKYNKGRFYSAFEIVKVKKGIDFQYDTVSFGGNVYRSYANRTGDVGVNFLQGSLIDFTYSNIDVSYIINPKFGLAFTLHTEYRLYRPDQNSSSRYSILFGLTTLLYYRKFDYFDPEMLSE
jgi:hypothetical protein